MRTEKRFTSEAVIQRKSRYTSEVAMQLVNEQVNVGEYEEVKIGEGEGINISVEFTGKNHFWPVRRALKDIIVKMGDLYEPFNSVNTTELTSKPIYCIIR